MTIEDFKKTVEGTIPAGLSKYLQALWHDRVGDWNKAHEVSQEIHDSAGYWIHAYLHRKEGDYANAGYWYIRAEKELPDYSLEQEWTELVLKFLEMENKKSGTT